MVTDWQKFNILEAEMLKDFQHWIRQPWLDKVIVVFTELNDAGKISILICILLLILKKYRKVGLCTSLALVFETLIINMILKPLVERPRPYIINEAIDILVNYQSDFSFPSGHTGSAVAVAGVMLLCMPKKYGIPAFLFAILMGVSRMYVGVHYFTDVLAGAGIGLGCAAFVVKFLKDKME